MQEAKSILYSSESANANSSVSEQSSNVGTKSLGKGMVCLLVNTFLHPTVSRYLLSIELQYLV
jgi:hypothetical protein